MGLWLKVWALGSPCIYGIQHTIETIPVHCREKRAGLGFRVYGFRDIEGFGVLRVWDSGLIQGFSAPGLGCES